MTFTVKETQTNEAAPTEKFGVFLWCVRVVLLYLTKVLHNILTALLHL